MGYKLEIVISKLCMCLTINECGVNCVDMICVAASHVAVRVVRVRVIELLCDEHIAKAHKYGPC